MFWIATIFLTMLGPARPLEAGRRFYYRAISTPAHPHTSWTLPYNDQTKAIICMNRPIPPQWVVVGVRHAVNCNGLFDNAWIIQRLPNYPGAELVICKCQPVPPGWGVVAEERTIYCGHGVNGLRIRKL
jgi:hypothetical protein